jgi:DNA-binding transcriptional regulator LsrR (DeoR family)
VDAEINRRTLGLTIDDLRGRRVIAVVGGGGKAEAILAAVKTGVITDLVLGEADAQRIAARLDEQSAAAINPNPRAAE